MPKTPRRSLRTIGTRSGFTLIELLIVIVIVGVLAVMIITAVNVPKQLGDAYDSERKHNAKQLENAMYQRLIDEWELLGQTSIAEGEQNAKPICVFDVQDPECNNAGGVDLSNLIPDYIAALPQDPAEVDPSFTGYMVYTENGRVKVASAHFGEISPGGGEEPGTLLASIIDNTSELAGRYTSITVGADGLPVVSYSDALANNLKFLKCGNVECSSGNILTTVDEGSLGRYTSVTMQGGLPFIAYYDAGNTNLKTVQCGDSACAAGNTFKNVDTQGTVGYYLDVEAKNSSDGFPVISYYDETNKDVKVLKCADASCNPGTSGFTVTTVDAEDNVGQFSAIALDASDVPVIAYYDFTNRDLKILKCGDISCDPESPGFTVTTVDSDANVGQYASIVVPPDSRPIVSYHYKDEENESLKVLKCGNAACTSGNAIRTVDIGPGGLYTSIMIGSDGMPIMSYQAFVNVRDEVLKVLHCADPACAQ